MTSTSFEHAAKFYDRTRGGLERGGHFASTLDAHLARGSRVLEIGVGTGLVALPLTERGHEVVGIDLAPSMLALAYERIGARVAIADAAGLPVASASVDAVVAVWVLHLVGDRDATAAEIARVLRPGGRALIVPAKPDEVVDEIGKAIGSVRARLNRDRDTPDAACALLTRAGLTEIARDATPDHVFEESPASVAEGLEAKLWSSCWNLSDEQWDEIVQPAIDRLRALPNPEQPLERRNTHHVIVMEKPA